MDEFGVLTERFGLKPQGKSAPMASSKRPNSTNNTQIRNFASNPGLNPKSSSKSSYNSNSFNGSFLDDNESLFSGKKTQNYGGLDDDIFGGFEKNSRQTTNNGNGSSFDYDSIFSNSNYSSAKSSFDGDILGGLNLNSSNSTSSDDIFGSFGSKSKQSAPIDDLFGNFGAKSKTQNQNISAGFDDLIPGFGSSNSSNKGEHTGMNKSTFTLTDDPFVVLESTSTATKSSLTDPLEEFNKLSHSRSTKSTGSSNFSPSLKPPPKPGQVLKSEKVKASDVFSIDELEDFAMGRVRNNADGRSDVHYAKEVRDGQTAKASKYKEAEDAAKKNQQKSADDIESFFSMGSRSTSAPKSRTATLDPLFDAKSNGRGEPVVTQKKSSFASSGIRKASSTTNIIDDFMFGDASLFGEFEEVEGESEERRRARLGRHQRTQDRVAKAVADMNQRDLQTQHEQEERRRIADNVDAHIKRWAAGKEGNMRALLSSLQYVLWPECGWEPVSLTDLITSSSVKKVYRKATLYVHPDKVQQKGASLEQKYTAEKVFDILKEAWNKFNKEELS